MQIPISVRIIALWNRIFNRMRREIKNLPELYNQCRFRASKALDRRGRATILLLVDYKNWAFDNSARQIARQLKRDFVFNIQYVNTRPTLSAKDYDLIYVFFWGETYHQKFGFDVDRTIKEVSSHRWEDDPQYGPCSPKEMARTFLGDASTVICTSQRLVELIRQHHRCVLYTPNGIDPLQFRRTRERDGKLTIGWAGNGNDEVKGLNDILKPACNGHFNLALASGGLSHTEMNDFYNRLDVLAVTSRHEGEPLTLLEGMAAGCFPVCTDVGIVPEVIQHRQNGFIVKDRTPEGFRVAFEWCKANIDLVRKAGKENSTLVHNKRNWKVCAQFFKRALLKALAYARCPKFRNDDVSADTSLERFQEFCSIFQKYGINQIHGVTLRGQTNSYFTYQNDSVEYEGHPNVGKLPNSLIRTLSEDFRFEDRKDLINYLNESPDEIALHGLYHTDHGVMTAVEQREDMAKGLELLRKLLPEKRIRYFIAPFNRTNQYTYQVAAEFGLKVLAAEGVHLEEQLHDLHFEPETWYRYHHHRFYPESTVRYFKLSLEALDAALARNAERLQHDNRKCALPS